MTRQTATGLSVLAHPRTAQSGFTLLELLVVIAVLSVISGGAVFAMGSIRERSQEVACTTDERTLDTAEQAMLVATGSAGDEALLVSSGYIEEPSEYHDIALSGGAYTIVAVGPCVDNDGGPVEIAGPADPDAAKKAEAEPAKPVPTAPEPAKAEPTKPGLTEPVPTKPGPTTPEPAKPESRCKKGQVDINKAGVEELQEIKFVGKARAKLIIDARPFESVEQLEKVKGIGPKITARIIEQGVACIG